MSGDASNAVEFSGTTPPLSEVAPAWRLEDLVSQFSDAFIGSPGRKIRGGPDACHALTMSVAGMGPQRTMVVWGDGFASLQDQQGKDLHVSHLLQDDFRVVKEGKPTNRVVVSGSRYSRYVIGDHAYLEMQRYVSQADKGDPQIAQTRQRAQEELMERLEIIAKWVALQRQK